MKKAPFPGTKSYARTHDLEPRPALPGSARTCPALPGIASTGSWDPRYPASSERPLGALCTCAAPYKHLVQIVLAQEHQHLCGSFHAVARNSACI